MNNTQDIRDKVYLGLARRAPFLWKPLRFLLWGKVDFNDLDEWEKAYDLVSEEDIERWRERIPNLVNRAVALTEPFQSVLDISAGFGNFLFKVDEGKDRLATEYSNRAIGYLEDAGIPTKKAVLPQLPFENESVDVVVAISVFEHLASKSTVRKSFEECHRVCKKGMIFSVPYECMEPWNTLIHNHDFSKGDIQSLTKGLFKLENWEIIRDNVTDRSICFLRKL